MVLNYLMKKYRIHYYITLLSDRLSKRRLLDNPDNVHNCLIGQALHQYICIRKVQNLTGTKKRDKFPIFACSMQRTRTVTDPKVNRLFLKFFTPLSFGLHVFYTFTPTEAVSSGQLYMALQGYSQVLLHTEVLHAKVA